MDLGEGQTQLSMMEYLMNDSQGVGVGHLGWRRERFLFANEMVLPALASRQIVPWYPSSKIVHFVILKSLIFPVHEA